MELVFKELKDFPGYWITNTGELFSENYCGYRIGDFMKPSLNRHGYKRAIVYKNKKRYEVKIHQLVAKLFLDNPNNLGLIEHINDIKTDNRVENLRWGTKQSNSLSFYRNNIGLRKGSILKTYNNKFRSYVRFESKTYSKVFNLECDAIQWKTLKLRQLERRGINE